VVDRFRAADALHDIRVEKRGEEVVPHCQGAFLYAVCLSELALEGRSCVSRLPISAARVSARACSPS
jgi:hypothetical protein